MIELCKTRERIIDQWERIPSPRERIVAITINVSFFSFSFFLNPRLFTAFIHDNNVYLFTIPKYNVFNFRKLKQIPKIQIWTETCKSQIIPPPKKKQPGTQTLKSLSSSHIEYNMSQWNNILEAHSQLHHHYYVTSFSTFYIHVSDVSHGPKYLNWVAN